MEHKTLSDLGHVADFVPELPSARLTRRERLEQWVDALEREPERQLSTLHEIEHKSCNERRASRVDNSPLTVAFENPALRAMVLRATNSGMRWTTLNSQMERRTGLFARASTVRA